MAACRVQVPLCQVRRVTPFSLHLRKSGLCYDQDQGEVKLFLFVCANYFLSLTLKQALMYNRKF